MTQRPRVRKQVYELTLSDLDQYPVWEFALDEEGEEGQDEATVRPVEAVEELDPLEAMYIVSASFTLADGSTFRGCISTPVQGQDDLGTLQPVLITESGQRVVFWWGMMEPKRQEIDFAYSALARKPGEVFPLEVVSLPRIAGGPVRATVPGFLKLEDFRTGVFRVVT